MTADAHNGHEAGPIQTAENGRVQIYILYACWKSTFPVACIQSKDEVAHGSSNFFWTWRSRGKPREATLQCGRRTGWTSQMRSFDSVRQFPHCLSVVLDWQWASLQEEQPHHVVQICIIQAEFDWKRPCLQIFRMVLLRQISCSPGLQIRGSLDNLGWARNSKSSTLETFHAFALLWHSVTRSCLRWKRKGVAGSCLMSFLTAILQWRSGVVLLAEFAECWEAGATVTFNLVRGALSSHWQICYPGASKRGYGGAS